jgi:ubiquitin thioesterase protein OTUB1
MSDTTAAAATTTTSTDEPILSDEQILEFEQQIKDEEAQKVSFFKKISQIGYSLERNFSLFLFKIPLVCQEESISKLVEEFKDNEPFLKKINVRAKILLGRKKKKLC